MNHLKLFALSAFVLFISAKANAQKVKLEEGDLSPRNLKK